jgi:septum formation protein
MPFKNKLILASGSPRRRELISYLFENNQVLLFSCDEPKWQAGQSSKEYLRLCLEAKWCAALRTLEPKGFKKDSSFLLVADTIVVLGSQVLGKPSSAQEAFKMLSLLSRSPHVVQTGFRLGFFDSQKQNFIVQEKIIESRVKFRSLSAVEIKKYIATQEPMDKAGAYGFQGVGMQNIAQIEGSYTNIVGLPLEDLRKAAQEMGAHE